MTNKLNPVFALLGCIVITTTSLAQTKPASKAPAAKKQTGVTYTTDPATGVVHHFYKRNKTPKLAVMGDYATISLIYETEGDSLIFDSHKKGGDSLGHIKLLLKKSFNGCLEQGITMMTVGDSVALKVNTDSLFIKAFHMRGGVPPQMRSYKNLVFKLKLIKTETEQEMKDEQQKAMDAVKGKEKTSIAKYISDSGYHATPTTDSIMVLKHTVTTAKLIQPGDSVFISYVGKFLDGKVFDQSANHPTAPFVMIAGKPTLADIYSPNMHLIRGWIVAIGMMHEGDKMTILAPSSYAYGPQGMGGAIPPYSPLVFDMEIVKVVPAKQ